jgi:hypothetical protein
MVFWGVQLAWAHVKYFRIPWKPMVGLCESSEEGPLRTCHLGDPLGDFDFLSLPIRHAPVTTPERYPFGLGNILTDAVIGKNCLDQVSVVCGRSTASQATDGVGLN